MRAVFRSLQFPLLATLMALWALLLPLFSAAQSAPKVALEAADQPRVGSIGLAVGDVVRVDAEGRRHPLRPGDHLHEQDRLITGSNALLMVVFVDQARLALRPETELVIRRYRIDASGVDTRLEFDLVRGTVRQISGQGSRQQPERYRLNTPVAAIGVRGTDFLARASNVKTETYVHEGMIVVMPATGDCGAAGGACSSILASARATDAGRYLQIFVGGVVERSFVSQDDVERIFGIRLATNRENGGARSPAPPAQPSTASSTTLTFLPLIFGDPNGQMLHGSAMGSSTSPSTGASTAGAGVTGISAGSTTGSTAGITTSVIEPPLTTVALPTTLVWGRFSDPLLIPVTITVPYDEARQGRHVTVGELGQYALWRNDPKGTIFPTLTGRVDLSLAVGQAFYRTDTSTVAVAIDGARLSADFDLSKFSTELRLQAASGGPSTVLSASGLINDEGLFLSIAPDGSQRVAGAFSRNGKEAGYLFNKVVGGGVFQGITLWGIKR